MSLTDLKISTKLIGAFVVVALLGGALGLYAVRNMGQLNDADTALYEYETLGLSLVKEANLQRYAAVVALRDAILATSRPERLGALKRIEEGGAKGLELMAQARKLARTPETEAAFRKVDEAWKTDQLALEGILKRMVAEEMNIESPVLQYLRDQVAPPSIAVGVQMTELTKVFEDNAKNVSDGKTALYEKSRGITLGLIVLCVGVGVALGWFISRSVTGRLAQAVAGAERMSAGDMTVAMDSSG